MEPQKAHYVLQTSHTQSEARITALEAQVSQLLAAENERHGSQAWRSRIRVLACACIDEDVVLDEPPYPFPLHWPFHQHQRRADSRESRW